MTLALLALVGFIVGLLMQGEADSRRMWRHLGQARAGFSEELRRLQHEHIAERELWYQRNAKLTEALAAKHDVPLVLTHVEPEPSAGWYDAKPGPLRIKVKDGS